MSTIWGPRRGWRLMLVPVAAIGLAGLVACGTGAATTSSGSGSGTSDAAMQAFASCMAENGVTLPERGADGGKPAGDGAGSAGGAGGPGGAGGGAAGSGGAGAADGGSPPTGAPQAGGAGAMPAPPGVDATAWAAAQKACAQYAPAPPAS